MDFPVLIPSALGGAPLDLLHLRVARAPGPAGWNQAVLQILEEVGRASEGL